MRATPKPAHVLTGKEAESGPTSRLANDGCHFLSADGAHAACLTHAIEMGHITTTVTIQGIERARTSVKTHVIYKGMSGDAKGVQTAALAKVNALFRAKGFAIEGTVTRESFPQLTDDGKNMRWTFDGKSASSTRPLVFKSQGAATQRCCRFVPTSATYFKRSNVAGITFDMSCKFHSDAGKGQECFMADYNDESRPLDTRVRIVRLP